MKNIIKTFAEQIAQEENYLLINSITKGSNRNPLFEIYIDSKDGITSDNCADFSRKIKEKLENTDIGELDYKLIVSSPGIDEPIKFLDQYFKHINREFSFSYLESEKVLSIEAKLVRITDDNLFFSYKNEEIKVNFNNIKKAKVKISF
jgi:ribosome maturation factor RimP